MGVQFIAGTNPSSSNRGLEIEEKKVLFLNVSYCDGDPSCF